MKVLPYVYVCTHKENGQFYIGYREGNVKYNRRSENDLGKFYFTSGVIKKSEFSNYDFFIVAEFFDPIEAYWFEQELIKENWNNNLLLNKQYYDRNSSLGIFRHTGHTSGFTGKKHKEETLSKMRDGRRTASSEVKKLLSEKLSGSNHPNFGKHLSSTIRNKISESRKKYFQSNPAPISEKKGKKLSLEQKQKISESLRLSWERRKNS